jgi:multiple sugar transport system ATP-binding protein
MASLKLIHIYKVYDNGTKAVSDLSIDINDKEFIVFVGPSGCGKSTTLRMIAGLEDITSGDLFIGDRLSNNLEPKERDVAMVFQNYALYPHMTVYNNMAFGLKIAHYPKEEIEKRVNEAATILDIKDYLKKKPREMSGGQRQRVALGRAIVRRPKVFLLDEPLSNLDAKLRASMRTEISKLHKQLQTTFIYVTHDQIEAMTMGTRIVVMKGGFAQQIDTPKNVYNYPVNKFVAGFIGTPQMNFFPATLKASGKNVKISFLNQVITVPFSAIEKMDPTYLEEGQEVVMGIRAESIHSEPDFVKAHPNTAIKAIPTLIEELGATTQVNATLQNDPAQTPFVFSTPDSSGLAEDQECSLAIDPKKLYFFDKKTEATLLPRIPKHNTLKATVKGSAISLLGTEIPLFPAAKEKIKDGAYTLLVPPEAVKKGQQFTGNVSAKEDINGQTLTHLTCGSSLLFSLEQEPWEKEVSFAIDFTKVTWLDKEKKTVLEALPEENHFFGSLKKIRTEVPVLRHGKTATKKADGFNYDLNGFEIQVPVEQFAKTIPVMGKKFETHEVDYSFSLTAGTLGETGAEMKLKEILDYGDKKIGVFLMNTTQILHVLPDGFKPDQPVFHLSLTHEEIHMRDSSLDIQLT